MVKQSKPTATKKTKAHYQNTIVKSTILRCSLLLESEYSRWFVGDQWGWYYYSNNKKHAIPALPKAYDMVTEKFRTLHYTLAYFDPSIFMDIAFSTEEEKATGKLKSKALVSAYTFGIDIDTVDQENGHGANIHEPIVKDAVEAMATFFVEKLKAICPNSIHCLYSGGGIYVMVHHAVFEDWFKDYPTLSEAERIEKTDTLTDALNKLILDWEKEFYSQFPLHKRFAKADAIDGAKRVFKTIFSVHRKHPYAVIPLDKDNIKIDFEKARFPLSPEVLATGETWYIEHDTDNKFLEFLAPYLEKSKEVQIKKQSFGSSGGEVLISETPYIDDSEYPPCIRNLLTMPTCGAGATRALGVLAAFLGQVGVPENQAKAIWYGLAQRWHAAASETNVFESWYKKMNCPSCRKIMTPGEGYPSVDLAEIKACTPNSKCMSVGYSSPVFYVDKQLYIEKLKRDLFR